MTESPADARSFWRVFPWDSAAQSGDPFSPDYVPPHQWSGRFDLGGRPQIIYLAQSPSHAIAEKLQRYRTQTIDWPELSESGKRLAVAEVTLQSQSAKPLVDLCDPHELVRLNIKPDALMSRDFDRTRALSRSIYVSGAMGFTVWSSLSGDWHSTILFLDRLRVPGLAFGPPKVLELDDPDVREAARIIGLSLAGT